MGRYPELDPSEVRPIALSERESLVSVDSFVDADGDDAEDPLAHFPSILAGETLRLLADRVAKAARSRRPVVVMMGGHVIKTGVSPYLVRLAEAGVITAFAGNGSVAVHDTEIALIGRTSEPVADTLPKGRFGMARETAEFVNGAAAEAADRQEGFGEALGRELLEVRPPHVDRSLVAAACRLHIPFTLHVAIGADVVHQHPSCDGAALGEATLRDFRILAAVLGAIEGGVVLNLGSAVMMPEVFVKALNLARNLGHAAGAFATANLDFIQHYRPRENVLSRPTVGGGESFALTGHHEHLIPLLARAVLQRLGT